MHIAFSGSASLRMSHGSLFSLKQLGKDEYSRQVCPPYSAIPHSWTGMSSLQRHPSPVDRSVLPTAPSLTRGQVCPPHSAVPTCGQVCHPSPVDRYVLPTLPSFRQSSCGLLTTGVKDECPALGAWVVGGLNLS